MYTTGNPRPSGQNYVYTGEKEVGKQSHPGLCSQTHRATACSSMAHSEVTEPSWCSGGLPLHSGMAWQAAHTLSHKGLAGVQEDLTALDDHALNGQVLPDVLCLADFIMHYPVGVGNGTAICRLCSQPAFRRGGNVVSGIKGSPESPQWAWGQAGQGWVWRGGLECLHCLGGVRAPLSDSPGAVPLAPERPAGLGVSVILRDPQSGSRLGST